MLIKVGQFGKPNLFLKSGREEEGRDTIEKVQVFVSKSDCFNKVRHSLASFCQTHLAIEDNRAIEVDKKNGSLANVIPCVKRSVSL